MWSNDSPEQTNAAAGTALAVAAPPEPPPALRPPAAIMATEGAFDVPQALMERIQLCNFLADANLLPQALRKQPANVLLIMHKALALQIPLSVALEHLHVIDGRVGHSAELLRGLLARPGHILRWITITDKEVEGELVLRHDPHNPRREKFTIADATRMKLAGKDNWTKDPTSMMVARVTTRLVSRHCPEVALALGNLSAIDVEDEPAEVQPAATGNDKQAEAEQIHAQSLDVTDAAELTKLGTRAREAGLLEIVVAENTTLQQALLQRINEINTARKRTKSDSPDAEAAAK